MCYYAAVFISPAVAQLHKAKTGNQLPAFPHQTVNGRLAAEQHPEGIIKDLGSLTNPLHGFNMSYDPNNHLAIKIEGKYIISSNSATPISEYMERIKSALQIQNSTEFKISEPKDYTTNQTFYRVSQLYNNVPVHGSDWIIVTRNNYVEISMGRMYPTPAGIATVPLLSKEQAILMVNKKLSDLTTIQAYTSEQINIFGENIPEVKLEIYYNALLQPTLTYHITIRPNLIERYVLIVDANTGETIDYYNHTCSANGPRTATMNDLNNKSRTINTYEYNGSFYPIDANETMFSASQSQFPDGPEGVIWTLDAKIRAVQELLRSSFRTILLGVQKQFQHNTMPRCVTIIIRIYIVATV